MKKILILGAGIYQVPLIKKAQEMGIHTVVTSRSGNYPGFSIADKAYSIDTTDIAGVLDIAATENIDGILTTGTDVAVPAVGKTCDEFGLKGLSYKAALVCSQKLLMKQEFERSGIRTARFRKCRFDMEDVLEKTQSLSFPLMLKAVDSSGSRGVIKVKNSAALLMAMEYVRNTTKKNYFIAEEFLEGTEFGAQAFCMDGRVQFLMLHGDYVLHRNAGVPTGHYVPYDLPEEVKADAQEQIAQAARALGLDNCAVNADLMLCGKDVYVLEIAGRAGATCLPELVSVHYGYDYYEKMILCAIGESPSFSSIERNPCAAKLIISQKSGTVRSIRSCPPHGNILQIQIDCKKGEAVRSFSTGPDRVGHIIAGGITLRESEDELEKAMAKIRVDVE